MSGTIGPDAPGFFTPGSIDSLAIEEQGISLVPASTGDVLGATFNQAFVDNPTTRLTRLIDRNLNATPRTLQANEANEMFGVPGRLTFDEPVTMDVARDLYDHHRANVVREDAIARRQGGNSTGMVARFGVGLAASMLDPLNVASAFVPFLGEARVAAALGGAAAGAGERFAVRAAVGAGQGFMGAAALEPLNMFLAAQDHDDYTMGDALVNLAFGTVAGGILHAGAGVFADRRGRPNWSPDQNEAAVRQGVAAMVEGRPIQAAAAIELTAAREARSQLNDWYEAAQRTSQDADTAIAQATDRTALRGVAEQRFAELRQQADTLRTEADELRSRVVDDPATAERLQSVNDELSRTIPAARRVALEQERTMLLEGGTDSAEMSLERARSEAAAVGVSAAADRVADKGMRAAAEVLRARIEERRANRLLSAQSVALSAREDMTAELAARTIRQLAGKLASKLEPGEAADMASRLLRAKPEEAAATIRSIVDDLTSRRWELLDSGNATEPSAVPSKMAEANQALATAETNAANSLGLGLTETTDPRVVEARRVTEAINERAPKAEGTQSDQLTELRETNLRAQQLIDAQDRQQAERAKAEGREPPKPDREIEAAKEIEATGSAWAKAYEAAAICLTGRA